MGAVTMEIWEPSPSPQRPLSASGLKTYDTCPRKWAFRYLEGHEDPGGPATEHGKFIHAQMEDWLRSGRLPQHPQAVALLALYSGKPYAPTRANTAAEHEFTLRIGDVAWRGFIDGRSKTPERVIIIDWKTTGDMQYALRPDRGVLVDSEGVPDVQNVLYAAQEFVGGAPEVEGHWNYVTTKGALRAKQVVVNFDRARVEDIYGGMHSRALETIQLHQIRPKASDVPYRSTGCFAFRKPCPYTDRCIRPAGMFQSQPLDLASPNNQGTPMASFLEAMKNSFPGSATEDAPPPPPDSVPPPPPEEDEDPEAHIPPIKIISQGPVDVQDMGSIGDDAPPPPPEDDEHAAERLVAEYYAAQGKTVPRSSAEMATPESGFVNSPEAASLEKAPSTPEEAAEIFGAAPAKVAKTKVKKPTAKEKKLAEAQKSAAIIDVAVERLEEKVAGVDEVYATGEVITDLPALSEPFSAEAPSRVEAIADAVFAKFREPEKNVGFEGFGGQRNDISDAEIAKFRAEGALAERARISTPEVTVEPSEFGAFLSEEIRRILREELRAYFSR